MPEIAAIAKAAPPAFGRKGAPQPLGKVVAIIASHHLVTDAVGELLDARFQRSAALGRGEVAALELARPEHLGERTRRSHDFLERTAAAGADEIVGVLPFGQQREAQALAGREERQREIGGAECGLLSGAVTIEAEDRLVRHLPEQRELALGQRGAERRDGARKTRGDHGDDVDIAFDHDDRAAVMRGLSRGRVIVEIVALVEERRLRRIQVFCRNVLLQRAPAEGDDATAQIRDRKHHAIAEAIIGHGDVVAADQQAGLDHVFDRDALLAEMLLQREAFGRGVAHAKLQLRRRR